MLTEACSLQKVAFLDTVFEGTKADDGGFDTDVAIATGELVKLIPDLIEALGGEAESGVASAAEAIAAGGPAAAPLVAQQPPHLLRQPPRCLPQVGRGRGHRPGHCTGGYFPESAPF